MAIKRYILSWEKDFLDGVHGDVYDTLDDALAEARSGQFVHEVIATLHRVKLSAPTTEVLLYDGEPR